MNNILITQKINYSKAAGLANLTFFFFLLTKPIYTEY